MDNVVQLRNTGGFTRMDNQLMDALAAVHLSPAEFKTLHAITRLVIGYNLQERRITADEVAKMTNILPAHASRAISSLLARRVLYRVGGSRGEIGICSPSEWVYQEPKKSESTQPKSVEITKIGSLDNVAKLPISDDSLLYSKKEPLVTVPSEQITAPQGAEAAKAAPVQQPADERSAEPDQPVRKRATRLPDDWALPAEWLSWAMSDRPEFTQRDVLRTAEQFADYWHAAAGRGATKLDWFATWRNWFRRERAPRPVAQARTAEAVDFDTHGWLGGAN